MCVSEVKRNISIEEKQNSCRSAAISHTTVLSNTYKQANKQTNMYGI